MGECKGLPLALVTVGSALREKDVYYWTAAKGELKKSKVTLLKGVSQTVVSCLRLSYKYIEGEDAKLLFLLCCLFPEDWEIEMEVLVRYALGNGLLLEDDVGTIEEARTLLHAKIFNLKASHLVLEGKDKDHVKMHDVVRDAAISISSEDENHRFLIRIGQGLTEWPRRSSIEQYAAVSLMHNDIKELSEEGSPDAAKLEILSLRGNEKLAKISDSFFQGMKILSVLDVSKNMYRSFGGKFPLQMSSFQFLTHLRTLLLDGSHIDDLSGIGKLKQLQILSLRRCAITSKILPVEMGELSRLRLLNLSECFDLVTVPANVISRLSRLEELYMTDSFSDWVADGSNSQQLGEESKNASLSEVQSLRRLTKLRVSVEGLDNFPADFTLPQTVSCFSFVVGPTLEFLESHYPEKRYLGVCEDFDHHGVERSLCLAGALKVDCLELEDYGVKKEIDPAVEEVTLTDLLSDKCDGLTSLSVHRFNCNITAITPMTPAAAAKAVFPNLQQLRLNGVWGLRSLGIQQGGGGGGVLPPGSLQNLTVFKISSCGNLRGAAIPSSWAQRLHNLEQLEIGFCGEVTEIFENAVVVDNLNGIQHSENDCTPPSLLPRLTEIKLQKLLKVIAIWNTVGSLHNLFPNNATSLLTSVDIYGCPKLVSLFPPLVSQSLSHLQTLRVENCSNLEVIFEEDGTVISPLICLPNLKSVSVSVCHNLKSLFTVSTARATPWLEVLHMDYNTGLQEIISTNNSTEVGDDNTMQIVWPHLRTMSLLDLWSLRRICPTGYSVDVPDIKTLTYYQCLMENFASGTTAYGLNIPQSVKPQLHHRGITGAGSKYRKRDQL